MSGILIMGTKRSHITARKLATKLDADYTTDHVSIDSNYELVFRYGNSYSELPQHNHLINPAFAIKRVCDKLGMRIQFKEHGINTPRVFISETIQDAVYPAIARPRNHFKGRDFNIVNTRREAVAYLNMGYYLQELINNGVEYRIFVFQDKILEVSEKSPKESANLLIRNHDNGWIFKWVTYRDLPRELRDNARLAVQLAGLQFAGVDCCISQDGQCYIFEVNSAPSLNDRKAEKLADRIMGTYF